MEKLGQFGVDPTLLAAQIINFLVLLYILKRFAYKPILAMLKAREKKIKEGLEAGAKGEELLVKAKDEEKEILHKASSEAREMLEETKKRGEKVKEELLSKAKEETETLMQDAKVRIAQEEETAEKELEGKVSLVAVQMLEKILPKVLSKQDHIRILESSQKMLERNISNAS